MYFSSVASCLLLLRDAIDTAWIPCWSFTPKRHRQLRMKDLTKVPPWRLQRDSNPPLFGLKVPNLPMSHHITRSIVLKLYSGSFRFEATLYTLFLLIIK